MNAADALACGPGVFPGPRFLSRRRRDFRGGSALFPFLVDELSEKFKMKCYVGDPWGRVVYQESLKPILNSIGPRMSVAIGLALRNVV